jgi:hypothetical protein
MIVAASCRSARCAGWSFVSTLVTRARSLWARFSAGVVESHLGHLAPPAQGSGAARGRQTSPAGRLGTIPGAVPMFSVGVH